MSSLNKKILIYYLKSFKIKKVTILRFRKIFQKTRYIFYKLNLLIFILKKNITKYNILYDFIHFI